MIHTHDPQTCTYPCLCTLPTLFDLVHVSTSIHRVIMIRILFALLLALLLSMCVMMIAIILSLMFRKWSGVGRSSVALMKMGLIQRIPTLVRVRICYIYIALISVIMCKRIIVVFTFINQSVVSFIGSAFGYISAINECATNNLQGPFRVSVSRSYHFRQNQQCNFDISKL